MPKKNLHMETTTVPVIKTCAEIEELLAAHDASAVWKEFKYGQIESIFFVLNIDGKQVPFKIPFRYQQIQQLARDGKTAYRKTADQDQARRIAARLVLRSLQAQFALVDVGQADLQEIFLSHVMVSDRETFYERLVAEGGLPKMLTGTPQKD